MADVISSFVIGLGILYLLWNAGIAVYYLAFGDDGFSWSGLRDVGVCAVIFGFGGFAAYLIGHLVLSVI